VAFRHGFISREERVRKRGHVGPSFDVWTRSHEMGQGDTTLGNLVEICPGDHSALSEFHPSPGASPGSNDSGCCSGWFGKRFSLDPMTAVSSNETTAFGSMCDREFDTQVPSYLILTPDFPVAPAGKHAPTNQCNGGGGTAWCGVFPWPMLAQQLVGLVPHG
jgi:hypothetical protein